MRGEFGRVVSGRDWEMMRRRRIIRDWVEMTTAVAVLAVNELFAVFGLIKAIEWMAS